MDDRGDILRRLESTDRKSGPAPYESARTGTVEELTDLFINNLAKGGGVGEFVRIKDLDSKLETMAKDFDKVLNLSDRTGIHSCGIDSNHLAQVDRIDLLIINGRMGVAGNGAVWITGDQLVERRFPFIAIQVVVILPKNKLLYDLTQAYQRIQLEQDGFGIWIAGPSKTADIEQSLVIGAQGARRHTVLITD